MSDSRQRKPWPMKWIVIAILACLIPYTWINLRYRKEGPGYRPYQDAQERANVSRLLSAGFQRIIVQAERPAESGQPWAKAEVKDAPAGLPSALDSTLVEKPLLPDAIIEVSAPPSVSALMNYPIEFTCALPDHKEQLAGAALYIKDDQIIITPDFENLSGELLARTRESRVLVTLPAGKIKPGRYDIILVGRKASKAWSVEIR